MRRRASLLDRRALFATGAVAALLAATGVSASGARRGGRLRIALSGARRDDDWLRGDGLFMQVARQGLIFDTLTEIAADGTLRPELATAWMPSSDARVWEIDLRRNVLFHDGCPFGASDVVASLRSNPAVSGQVTALGAARVRISLDVPDPHLPLRLAEPDCVIRAAHAPDAGIGTGLYRLRRFTPGQQLLAQRVESHWKDGMAGWFAEVELMSIPAETVRAQALGEYLVDAADLRNADVVAGLPDVTLLPDAHAVTQAVSRDLGVPHRIGRQHPLDNLRAAERWWFA